MGGVSKGFKYWFWVFGGWGKRLKRNDFNNDKNFQKETWWGQCLI